MYESSKLGNSKSAFLVCRSLYRNILASKILKHASIGGSLFQLARRNLQYFAPVLNMCIAHKDQPDRFSVRVIVKLDLNNRTLTNLCCDDLC